MAIDTTSTINTTNITKIHKSSNLIDESIIYNNIKNYLFKQNISNNYLQDIPPFIVDLPHGKFAIEKLIRVLPNRRLVFLAKNNAKNTLVIIKLFISNFKYNKDYDLLLNKYKLIKKCNLLTPKILFNNVNHEHKIAYIITTYITPETISPELLIPAIVDLHKNYLYQKDLHLNNFIVNNNQVYCLDCESIISDGKIFSNKLAYNNFALFLAQLDSEYYNNFNSYINNYLNLLNTALGAFVKPPPSNINKYIYKLAHKKLREKIKKFTAKTTRNCSNFIESKTKNNYLLAKREVYNNHQDFFKTFIADPEQFIQKYSINILKQGNTAHVYLINFNNIKFVIKYYMPNNFIKNIITNIKYKFKKPRCLSSWINANILESLKINTPSPIACIIFKKHGLIKQSFFIMQYSENYKSLATLNLTKSNTIINQIANLLHKFKILKIAHRDLKTVNLGLVNNNLTILDLDAMKIYNNKFSNKLFNIAHAKDIKRLLKCWQDTPALKELLQNKL